MTPHYPVGNLTADPEWWTPAGMAITTFCVASTPAGSGDRKDDQWKDGRRCSCDAPSGGMPPSMSPRHSARQSNLIVTEPARLKQRSFETRRRQAHGYRGRRRRKVGPSLRYLSATLNKAARATGGRASTGAAANGAGSDDSWASVEPPAFE